MGHWLRLVLIHLWRRRWWRVRYQSFPATFSIVRTDSLSFRYPMTSTKSLETGVSGPAGTRDDRLHRGRNVVGAFLMQG